MAELEEFFCAEDVDLIKTIPVRGGSDKWMWHFTKSGQYTVRSAYHTVMENAASPLFDNFADGDEADNSLWKKLWSLQVPKRAIHFAWRLLKDSLPTSANLLSRTVVVPDTCPLCSDGNGTLLHLFFQCIFAASVWQRAGLEDLVEKYRQPRGEVWFRVMVKECDTTVLEIILMLLDGVWHQRNRALFEHQHTGPAHLVATVVANLRFFKDARGWRESLSPDLLPHHLLRPPDNTPLIFVDAGIAQGAAGVGLAVCDAEGRFKHAEARRFNNIQDVALAEAMALMAGVQIVEKLKISGVGLVSDALQVINMIHGEEPVSVTCLGIIPRIISGLGRLGINLYWVPRHRNLMAHSLATFAKTSASNCIVWDNFPSFMSNVSGRFPQP